MDEQFALVCFVDEEPSTGHTKTFITPPELRTHAAPDTNKLTGNIFCPEERNMIFLKRAL